MICERCGSFLPDDALTCDHCGAFLGDKGSSAMKDTGVRAIRQGRSGSQKPTLPVRQGGMREYGDYDLSPLPLEPADRAQRRRPVQPMSDTVRGSRPDTRRGVPVQSGHLRANPTPRKSVRLHPVRRHNINWMLIGLIVVVLGLGAFIGYEVYMARSDSGQRSTARKNVLSTFEPQLELAVSKDATRTTEKEDLLKQWNSATAQSYWEVAQEFADGGDLETAITAYRMADILDSDNYDGLLDMASTYEMMNQNDKAEELYLNLIENVSPFRSEAYTALIRLYQNTDRGPEAAEMMKLAYENTDRETFRLQRREYIPQSPQVNLSAGRYDLSKMDREVDISSPQSFDIYYTYDDNAVLPQDGILYDGVSLHAEEGTVTLRAVCVNGTLVSDELSVSYTFYYPTPPAPKCNLAPNTYKTAKTVSLRAGTREEYTKKEQAEMEKNLTYYYTIDGSTPTEESPVYDGTPIQLPSGKVTLKAMCKNQYGKLSSILEVGYKFNIKPAPLEMYAETDTLADMVLLTTTQQEFEAAFGSPQQEIDTTYLTLEDTARHLEYPWGYAVFATVNKRWVLVRVEMTSSVTSTPRGVGFGATEAEVTGVYKDFGQVQSPNGTRGLYYDYPNVGKVLIDDDGTRYIQYTCQNKESKTLVLQYWLKNGTVNRIVNYYQP